MTADLFEPAVIDRRYNISLRRRGAPAAALPATALGTLCRTATLGALIVTRGNLHDLTLNLLLGLLGLLELLERL